MLTSEFIKQANALTRALGDGRLSYEGLKGALVDKLPNYLKGTTNPLGLGNIKQHPNAISYRVRTGKMGNSEGVLKRLPLPLEFRRGLQEANFLRDTINPRYNLTQQNNIPRTLIANQRDRLEAGMDGYFRQRGVPFTKEEATLQARPKAKFVDPRVMAKDDDGYHYDPIRNTTALQSYRDSPQTLAERLFRRSNRSSISTPQSEAWSDKLPRQDAAKLVNRHELSHWTTDRDLLTNPTHRSDLAKQLKFMTLATRKANPSLHHTLMQMGYPTAPTSSFKSFIPEVMAQTRAATGNSRSAQLMREATAANWNSPSADVLRKWKRPELASTVEHLQRNYNYPGGISL